MHSDFPRRRLICPDTVKGRGFAGRQCGGAMLEYGACGTVHPGEHTPQGAPATKRGRRLRLWSVAGAGTAHTSGRHALYSRRVRMICDSRSISDTATTMTSTMQPVWSNWKALIESNRIWPMPPAPMMPSTVAARLDDSKR